MSEPKRVLVHGDHLVQHGVPKGKAVSAHHITVEGFYFSSKIEPHNGHFEKKKIAYEETFRLEPCEAHLLAQNALSHVLGEKLPARLREKDKNFRVLQTHVIVKHENVLIDAPKKAEPKKEETEE